MAKFTLVTALVLIVLGVAFFVATGSHAPTALIPAYFGIVLGIALACWRIQKDWQTPCFLCTSP